MKLFNRVVFAILIVFCFSLCSCASSNTPSVISSVLSSQADDALFEDGTSTSSATTTSHKNSSVSKKASSSKIESSSKSGKSSSSKPSTPNTTTSKKPIYEPFTIAVIPDTQQEVTVPYAIENKLFLNRTTWLAKNKKELNLKMVVHTGDVVNWGNEEPAQFDIAKQAMNQLTTANIPYVISPGNHDTAAVGVGGSAADPQNTWIRVRDTIEFNKAFPAGNQKNFVPFEEGVFDNGYITFTVGSIKWLVMSLELWPRNEVITWANEVALDHPNHNIIVATHSFLTHNGEIYNSADYGSNSPQELFNRFIRQYENIKIVLSGHTGNALSREYYGIYGNKIACFLGCFHSNDKNPVQLLQFDPEYGSVTIRTYSPINNEEWTDYTATIDGMKF